MFSCSATRWFLACTVFAFVAHTLPAQMASAEVGPSELFRRVSTRLMDDWRRMPRYTCVQDIQRSSYRSHLSQPRSCSDILADRAERKRDLPVVVSDRLQLEVAVANRSEVHSWPGASSFVGEEAIRSLVGDGAFSSGDFATFIGGIFGGSAKITYEGNRDEGGRTLLEYSFQIAQDASQYEVDGAKGRVITGYGGSIRLDPQTEDLVHLTVRSDELPEATGSCQAISEIEYGRNDIHGIDVLIPRRSELRVVLRTGDESGTVTSYSSCRQFVGNARMLLDIGSATTKPFTERGVKAAQNVAPDDIPAGIKFNCRIITPIDSDTPAGRPIEGVLRSPIKDKDGTVWAPSGAHVKGRVVRLARVFATYDYYDLAVRLESVGVNGVEHPVYAVLNEQPSGPVPSKAQVGYDPSDYPKQLASSMGPFEDTGEFFFVQEHLRMHVLDGSWITTSPPTKRKIKQDKVAQVLPDQNRKADFVPLESPKPQTIAGAATTEVPAAPAVFTPHPTESHSASSTASPPTSQQRPDFRLRVESNLVIVRAVVRDSLGRAIENLRKEDFKLLDKGEEQPIAQFESVSSPTSVLGTGAAVASREATPGMSSVRRPTFLVLYFDDLNTSDPDLIQAREAAERYLATRMLVNEQVAIFTSNGPLTDFTDDPKQIQTALAKLRGSSRKLSRGHDCPELSDFQAQQITEFEDDYTIDAWRAALDEVNARCPLPPPPPGAPPLTGRIYSQIRIEARQVLDQAQILSRLNLQRLEQVVNHLAQFPGQRTVVLVSPGFLSESEQARLDRIIDRALREQVVVSALDAKGLALLMRETDVTRIYTPTANSGVIGATHNIDVMRESAATDVLIELAGGTGGEFFHNNNDLNAGFERVAGASVYYILAFAPKELDGEFHKLEVKLTRSKGSVEARRGYFAVKNRVELTAAPLGLKSVARTDLQQIMASRDEVHDLSVEVSTEVLQSLGETKELNVMVQLDLASVTFRKEGDRNLNTVTFVAGLYDNDGKWMNGEQKQFDLKLLDSELKEMRSHPVGVKNTFKLKPGKYLLREVVEDKEDHRFAALNRVIEVFESAP